MIFRLLFLLFLPMGCLDPANVSDTASSGGRGEVPENHEDDGVNDSGTQNSNGTPAMGEEGGPCYGNGTCNEGLTCLSGLCVDASGGNSENIDSGVNPTMGDSILNLDPWGPLDFGSPTFLVGVERQMVVKNVGQVSFSVLNAQLTQGTSDEFVIETNTEAPWALAPDEELEITVIYTLADGEPDLGALLLTTTAESCEPECANAAALTVEFISEFQGERNLSFSPNTFDFGHLGIGEVSAPATVVISNDGTLNNILTVHSIEALGSTAQFQYILPSTPLYILPGQAVPVQFVYAPIDCDDHELTVTVSANSDSTDRQSLSATLNGAAPPSNPLIFEPPTLSFSALALGESETLSSTLKLVGCEQVTLTSGQMASGGVQPFNANLATGLPYTLQPGATVQANVIYAPYQGGTDVGTYEVYAQGFAGPVTLPVMGQNYVPLSISVVMGPERLQTESNCMCTPAGDLPAANVDLSYRVSPNGASCAKPSDPSCGIGGGTCTCNMGAYGNATWRAYTEAQVGSELWVIDEEVVHDGPGESADFVIKANLLDDCLLGTGGASYSILANCCIFDCEGTTGTTGNRACFDYSQFNVCATDCPYFSQIATSAGCMKRGPVPIRTTVKIPSDGSEGVRVFCLTMSGAGSIKNILTVTKTQTSMSISQVHSGVTEISPGQICQ